MKQKMNANQIIEKTVRFGIINLYTAPDISLKAATGRSADDRVMQSNVVCGVMAYKPPTFLFNKRLKGLFTVNGQRRHISI